MVKIKKWEELDLSDNYMFCKVMLNEELCKEMLEKLLGIKVHHLKYIEEEKRLDFRKDAKGIRLDVYVEDGDGLSVYDVEMQTVNTLELPKRSRYYQGMIDLNTIKTGAHYRELKQSYVIFICTFDLFGMGLHKYTFENICHENKELLLEDGAYKVFFNAYGTAGNVNKDVKAFLDFVAGNRTENEFVDRLETELVRVSRSDEWRLEYMTLYMQYQEYLEAGKKEGILLGREAGKKEGILLGREAGKKEGILLGREAGKEEGILLGREAGKILKSKELLIEILEELGDVSMELKEMILNEADSNKLDLWVKAAIKSKSLEEFRQKIQQ